MTDGCPARAGTSLIEVLVALVIVSIAALALGAGATVIGRIHARLDAAAAVDLARENTIRLARRSPACLDGGSPRMETLVLPAAGTRGEIALAIRCGR